MNRVWKFESFVSELEHKDRLEQRDKKIRDYTIESIKRKIRHYKIKESELFDTE